MNTARVQIRHVPGDESATCSALIAALIADPKRRFFNDAGVVREASPNVLRRATSGGLQLALSTRMVLMAEGRSGKLHPIPIPGALLRMVLARPEAFPPLPPEASQWRRA